MTSVTLKNITKNFGQIIAVDNVSLEIKSGELFFLLGASGCGKTTILRIIAGFYRPDHGSVRFGDRDITSLPPQKRNTGMVFQNYALWPHLKVFQNVEYGLNIRKVGREEKAARVNKALETVQMHAYRDRLPNQLSGGQQQRIALARALVIEPDVLLFDEPLSNLDAKLRLEMRREIKRIHRTTGITTIYVTHDQKEALSMADRLAVMSDGKIEQIGSPKEAYHRPANRFVAEFIGEANIIPGTAGKQVPEKGLEIKTAIGSLFATVNTDNIKENESVPCMIRPEAVKVGLKSPVNTFDAQIEDIIYQGENEQYFLKIRDVPVKAIRQNLLEASREKGQTVPVSFGSDQVVILK